MKIIFTKSPSFISRFIRWGLDEQTSHVAIQMGDFICDSGVKGVDVNFHKQFFSDGSVVVWEIPLDGLLNSKKQKEFKQWMAEREGQKYDFFSYIWWCYVGLKKKIFGTQITGPNKTGRKNALICTEILEPLKGVALPENAHLEGWSPDMCYYEIKKNLSNKHKS